MRKISSFFTVVIILGIVGFIICGIMMDWFTTKDTIIEPTCTVQGYTLHRGWFGQEDELNPVAPKGHRYTVQVTEATCLTEGTFHYTCADCGHTYDGTPAAPLGHHYVQTITEPTCEAGGYTVHTCTACGDSYRDSEVAPIGHIYMSSATAATCVQGGYTTHTCVKCDYTYRDSEVEPLGHDNKVEVTVPTCLTPGFTLTLCRRCATAAITDPKEAFGHNYLPYVTHATCETGGYTTYICSHCQDTYTADIIDARGHNYVATVQTATTTRAGGTVHACTRCEDSHMTDVYTYAEVFDGRQGDGKGIYAEGIDLSYHNQDVDFKALKADGIDFVILRIGTSRTKPDTMFETYYAGAREAGLDIGIYFYSYAKTVEETKQDAAWVTQVLQGKSFEYPIFFDMEDESLKVQSISTTTRTDIVLAFCEEMVNAGYYPGLYTNLEWIKFYLEIERISCKYDIWLAHPTDKVIDYSNDYAMWQYTYQGKLDGVATDVDLNRVYRDFPTYIKQYGYNGYSG